MKRLNGMDAMLLYSETPNLHMHTLKVAITAAFSELRSAAGLSAQASTDDVVVEHAFALTVSGGQNSVQRRVEQTQPVVGRPGQGLGRVLGVRHEPDDATVG